MITKSDQASKEAEVKKQLEAIASHKIVLIGPIGNVG